MVKNKRDIRLTKVDERGKPVLINKLYFERAINKLFNFESTGYTPEQIEELQVTIHNLRQRVKKLEDWQ